MAYMSTDQDVKAETTSADRVQKVVANRLAMTVYAAIPLGWTKVRSDPPPKLADVRGERYQIAIDGWWCPIVRCSQMGDYVEVLTPVGYAAIPSGHKDLEVQLLERIGL
jgi:hypothetical protein